LASIHEATTMKLSKRTLSILFVALPLLRTRPVSTTCRVGFMCEIVCPLICKLMGKRDDDDGSFWSGAAAALGLG
jgi:hypothetical protein